MKRFEPKDPFSRQAEQKWLVCHWAGRLKVTPDFYHALSCERIQAPGGNFSFKPPLEPHTHLLTLSYTRQQDSQVTLLKKKYNFHPLGVTSYWADWAAFQICDDLARTLMNARHPSEVLKYGGDDHTIWWPKVIEAKYKACLKQS